MKNFIKSAWDNLYNNLFFFFLGAMFFIQIDLWYFMKMEPATFTATASSITLLLAVLALSKVNEWLAVKKSEKAFERTSLFIESLHQSFRNTSALVKSMKDFNISHTKLDPFFAKIQINRAEESLLEARKNLNEAIANSESFEIWSITFHKKDEFENLIKAQAELISFSHVLISIVQDPSTVEIRKEGWEKQIVELEKCNSLYLEERNKFKGVEYAQLFKIEKKAA